MTVYAVVITNTISQSEVFSEPLYENREDAEMEAHNLEFQLPPGYTLSVEPLEVRMKDDEEDY